MMRRRRKEIEEIVGFTYQPSLEILALMDVIVNRIGLEKVQGEGEEAFKGIEGCLLLWMCPGPTSQGDSAG